MPAGPYHRGARALRCVDRDVVDDVLLRVGPLMAFELCLDVSVEKV